MPGGPAGRIANFVDEPGRLFLHKRGGGILKMVQERAVYVVGVPDKNPFERVRDSIDSRGGRRISLDAA